jgi:hypothetical protein
VLAIVRVAAQLGPRLSRRSAAQVVGESQELRALLFDVRRINWEEDVTGEKLRSEAADGPEVQRGAVAAVLFVAVHLVQQQGHLGCAREAERKKEIVSEEYHIAAF